MELSRLKGQETVETDEGGDTNTSFSPVLQVSLQCVCGSLVYQTSVLTSCKSTRIKSPILNKRLKCTVSELFFFLSPADFVRLPTDKEIISL